MMLKVGRIWLAGPDGQVHITARYDTPVVLREPTLMISGSVYVQFRQEANGTWVYRYDRKAPTQEITDHLSDFRNAQSENWDGPAPLKPVATFQAVKAHFEDILQNDVSNAAVEELYQHFLAACEGQRF